MKGWFSLEYIFIFCLNLKNRCSFFISRDLIIIKVFGLIFRILRVLVRNMFLNILLFINILKVCEENELVKLVFYICM